MSMELISTYHILMKNKILLENNVVAVDLK